MKSITFSDARENLADIIGQITEDREPVTVTKRGGQSVVLMSLAEYRSEKETSYLLRSPVNAQRLLDSIEQLESL